MGIISERRESGIMQTVQENSVMDRDGEMVECMMWKRY